MKLQFESSQLIFVRKNIFERDLDLESISVLLILKKKWKKNFSQSFWQFDQR